MALREKVVLITGAGGGLGRATAKACAEAGARVFLVDLNAQGLAETGEAIAAAGGSCFSLAGDLTRRQTCIDAVAGALNAYGRLDGLCNIAGITLFHRTCEVSEADWNETLAITLSAPFFLSQAAIPELIRTRGSIVNVASSNGLKGAAYIVPYASAKAGLIHMTKSMAAEFIKEPIRINVIAPGGMFTGIMQRTGIPADLDRSLIDRYAGARPPVEPEEVARLIVYVLSDATPSLHGAVISADGGITAS